MRKVRFATSTAALVLLTGTPDSNAGDQVTQPCELLTESLVRKVFEVPEGTVIEQKDDSHARFPSCNYRWRVMSEAEEQEAKTRNNEKMMENVRAHKPPTEGIDFNVPSHERVHLTLAEFDTPEKAQSGLEGARTFMISRAEQAGREPIPWTPVDDVGSKAYYHGKQLSFVWGRLLIHIDASPEKRALTLAEAVMN